MEKLKPTAFRFKQFVIHQQRAAMKVGFDGILLGAWTDIANCDRILDVGTGTGLIALMLAQRTGEQTRIDAVELDEQTAVEAAANVARTPWNERVTVIHDSLQSLSKACARYDLVVCNPPYFERGMASSDVRRARARHDPTLTLEELMHTASAMLTPSGRLNVILPARRLKAIMQLARSAELTCRRQLHVRPLPHKPVHRILFEFGRELGAGPDHKELTIERRHHEYTTAFRQLARDYYLAF